MSTPAQPDHSAAHSTDTRNHIAVAYGTSSTSTTTSEPLIHGFHQSSHELAMTFSQVPWMRFSIVAQPDFSQLASNESLKGFVHDITAVTVSTVSKEIHTEITRAIDEVIQNIGSTVSERMTKVHEGIINEILCVNAKTTATDYERLGISPFDHLLKDLCSGSSINASHTCPTPSLGLQNPPQKLDKRGTTVVDPISQPETTEPTISPHQDDAKPASDPNPAASHPPITTFPEPQLPSTSPEPLLPSTFPEPQIPSTFPVGPAFPITVPTPGPAPVPVPTLVPTLTEPILLPVPSLQHAPWVWTPEVQRTPKPKVGHTRAFRRTLDSPVPVTAVSLSIACDDLYTVYVNGNLVGCGEEWLEPDHYAIRFPPTTKVVIAILASQGPKQKDVGLSVSGFIYDAFSTNAASTSLSFHTDPKWVCYAADKVSQNFFEADFDDSSWSFAFVQNTPWRKTMMGGVRPGKSFGKRIQGVKKVPEAPRAPVAQALSA